jgi:hypothetical protein
MKRQTTTAAEDETLVPHLPDDVWCLILRHFRLGASQAWFTVCSQWCRVIPPAVTRLHKEEVCRVRNLTRFVNLSHLSLKDPYLNVPSTLAHITGSHISGLVSLRRLNLTNNETVDGESLRGLTNLTVLNLNNNARVTADHITHLTRLKVLRLAHNETVDCGTVLPRFTKLGLLEVSGNRRVRDEHLTALCKLDTLLMTATKYVTGDALVHLPRLRCLKVSWYKQHSYNLPRLSALRALEVVGDGVIDDTELSLLTRLETLELWSNHSITGTGISTLTNLHGLRVEYNRIEAVHLVHLTRLEILVVGKLSRDMHWPTLAHLTRLRDIRIYRDRKYEECVQAIRAVFPAAVVNWSTSSIDWDYRDSDDSDDDLLSDTVATDDDT